MDSRAIVNVIDNLESTSATDALSANMGRELKGLIEDITIPEVEDSGWITLSLSSGITQYNSTSFPTKYRKIGNVVYLKGAVKGITAANTTIATLPAASRPNNNRYFVQAGNGGRINTFEIQSTGEIVFVNTTATSFSEENYYMLDTSFIID